MKAICLASGGLDSTVLAYLLKSQGYDLHLLSFDYGQRHKKEIHYAQLCAERLSAQWDLIDLTSLTHLLKGSALTDDIAVPDGHYADENMKVTVVPNRNAVMLSIAYAVAVAEQAEIVAMAVHAGDHPIYPDCRPKFIRAFDWMEQEATEGHGHPDLKLYTPFVTNSKADIVRMGDRLGVPFQDTWSCYKGNGLQCGLCGTCYERRESFELSGIKDLTRYECLNVNKVR